jgi:uncharacterized protein (DUF433 family)
VSTRDPEVHSSAPVFMRTRIAVKALFDYLEDGQTVDDFVSYYPSVSREQAIAALEEVEEMLGVTAGSKRGQVVILACRSQLT